MIEIEVVNRSGTDVDEAAAVELARSVLAGEGVGSGELGLAFVGREESRALKQEHLGVARQRRDAHAAYTASRASISGPWS